MVIMLSLTAMRRRYLLVLPAILALALAACSSSSSTSSGTTSSTSGGASSAASGGALNVMVIAPFTLAVQPSKANYDAVRIQAALQNAKGGINGHKINVIGCDDQSDPNVGAQCAKQAVQDHVVALLGVFSLVSASIWPIVNAAGIPEIGLVQYGAGDMISPNAWPLTAPAPVFNGAGMGYLATVKGCKRIADVQANTGADTAVPLALDKEATANTGATYVGPFLLPVTQGLADAPAIARSIVSKADCANVSDGQNGVILMKAILQEDPNFKLAANELAVPGDWPTQLGSQGSAVNTIGGLAPDTSKAPGIVSYLTNMKAQAPGDPLSDFSKLAWASWYAFAQVASGIKGPITAQSVTAALGKSTSINTEGITAPADFTKPATINAITRIFTTKVFVLAADNGTVVQSGGLLDAGTYFNSK
jgi:ABC-type branched-subunit amino acid transport system substrate-binding protein